MADFLVREIQRKDNEGVEAIIRSCLVEFGGDHEGTAWTDPDLGRFSEVYNAAGRRYFVAEREGKLLGGAGIGELCGAPHTCELQKMYCLPEARGTEIPHALMEKALEFAARYYRSVYLETLENMIAAQRFYEKYGFRRLSRPLADTGHFACNFCYIKEIGTDR